MKRPIILFILLFLLLATTSIAEEKKLTVSIQCGMNGSNLVSDIKKTKARLGYTVGVTIDYPLKNHFFFKTGLSLTKKGMKVTGEESYEKLVYALNKLGYGNQEEEAYKTGRLIYNSLYLQLPLHLAYKVYTNDITKIVFDFGPYIAYGLGGKTSIRLGENKYEEDTFQENYMKRFDFGLGLGMSIELSKVVVSLGYDFSLTHSLKLADIKGRNSCFYVNLGYLF